MSLSCKDAPWGPGLLGLFGILDARAVAKHEAEIREHARQAELAWVASGGRLREREVRALEVIAENSTSRIS